MMPGIDGWGVLEHLQDDARSAAGRDRHGPHRLRDLRPRRARGRHGLRLQAVPLPRAGRHLPEAAACPGVLHAAPPSGAERRRDPRRTLMVEVKVLSRERAPIALGELVNLGPGRRPGGPGGAARAGRLRARRLPHPRRRERALRSKGAGALARRGAARLRPRPQVPEPHARRRAAARRAASSPRPERPWTSRFPAGIRRARGPLREAGGRAYLVGGAVRDALLGLPLADFDVEVYGLAPERLREAARAARQRRRRRPGVHGLQALGFRRRARRRRRLDPAARLEGAARAIAASPSTGDPQLSIEEAARRRDFTINALLLDPLTGELLDPHGGRRDLEARVLRAVDAASFGEDPLRALRAVQLAARFELTVDPETARLCAAMPLARAAGRARLRRDREAAAQGAPALARVRAAARVGDAAGGRARAPPPRRRRRRIRSGTPRATSGPTRCR